MHQFKFPLARWVSLQAVLWLLVLSSLPAATFNVADFGARPDDPALASPAIQKAIDAAAQAGGGKVVFAKGTYLTGALFLKSNVELHLGEGVVLRAVPDDAAYPDIWSRVAGVEMQWPAAVVNVYGRTNVSVTGQGTLDGNGEYWWRKFWGEDRQGGMLKDYVARGLRWAVDYDCQCVRALMIYDSKDVKVSGDDISFAEPLNFDGQEIRIDYKGKVSGDEMKLTRQVGDFATEELVAKRVKEPAIKLPAGS